MRLKRFIPLAASVLLSVCIVHGADYRPAHLTPPEPAREFRGVWIATVANIDWPSKPGLSTAQQKAELIAILDRAVKLKLNAVIFQVRPACDAMYASKIEPWSEYLTGTMGKASEPYYDPLKFAIEEAHKRGLELHAWFNPFRARHFSGKSPIASNHISKTHPNLVRKYGRYLWLDPGEHDVQDYSLSVVMDVVNRYDVDGIHFDDYFYPYAEHDAAGKDIEFPDEASWRKYGVHSGLSRDDWRRANVNGFIERTYRTIKAAKPWVEFGISPFGIWRPGFPSQIKGFDAYAKLYADSRKWLADGWLDYFAPQLYWQIAPPEQSFPALLNWWSAQNTKGRHLWPGLASANADHWKPDELPEQIRITRKQSGSSGYILWNMSSLMHDDAFTRSLENLNSEPALVPASPWLDKTPPPQPALNVATERSGKTIASWKTSAGEPIRNWVLQTRSGGVWTTQILPAEKSSQTLWGSPEAVAIRAVDRAGNLSAPSAVQASESHRSTHARANLFRSPKNRSLR